MSQSESLIVCPWCHTEVERACKTILECKTCREPYTLTAEQSEQARCIVAKRQPLKAPPVPIDEDR